MRPSESPWCRTLANSTAGSETSDEWIKMDMKMIVSLFFLVWNTHQPLNTSDFFAGWPGSPCPAAKVARQRTHASMVRFVTPNSQQQVIEGNCIFVG